MPMQPLIINSHNHLINEYEIQYGLAFDQYFDQNYTKSIEICKKLIIIAFKSFNIDNALMKKNGKH